VISFTLQPFYSRGKNPRYTLYRRTGGPCNQYGRFGEKIIVLSLPRTERRFAFRPARSLYRLRYTSSQPIPTTLHPARSLYRYTTPARSLYRLLYTSSQLIPTKLHQLAAYTNYATPELYNYKTCAHSTDKNMALKSTLPLEGQYFTGNTGINSHYLF
jgi:hypothetical protein